MLGVLAPLLFAIIGGRPDSSAPMSVFVFLCLSVCVGPGARTLATSASSVRRVPLLDAAPASSRAQAGLMPVFGAVLQSAPSIAHSLYDRAQCGTTLSWNGGVVAYYFYAHLVKAVRVAMGVGGIVALSHCRIASLRLFVDLLTFDAPLLWAAVFLLMAVVRDRPACASGLSSCRSAGSVSPSRSVLIGMLLIGGLGGAHGVCPHCKDSILGCKGGVDCPLFKEQAANAALFTRRVLGSVPRVTYHFPPELAASFSRPVCEAIVGMACAPAPGREIDLENDAAYSTCRAVVQAASFHHCSVAEASSVLTARLEAATEGASILKIRGAMESLNMVSDAVEDRLQGVYGFLWAKVSNVVMKRGASRPRVTIGVKSKASASELAVTLRRPASEFEFGDMLHYFQMVVVGLGICSFWVVSRFLDDVVWATRRVKESWMVAHELLVLYLAEVDRDPTSAITMGTVFRRGGQDTLMAEARRNAVVSFGAGAADRDA